MKLIKHAAIKMKAFLVCLGFVGVFWVFSVALFFLWVLFCSFPILQQIRKQI